MTETSTPFDACYTNPAETLRPDLASRVARAPRSADGGASAGQNGR